MYNTDQQKMAVHNGITWQYLAPAEAGQFQNAKRFVAGDSQFWTVPTGVTRILAEVWGGGATGPVYAYNNSNELLANGGGAGGYSRGFITVTPGETLTLTVGSGGRGASRISNRLPGNGENTTIKSAALAPTGGSLLGAGGGLFDVGYGGIGGSRW